MKKKLPKYQTGNTNPCGPGTVWDDIQKKCVPAQQQNVKPVDPVFANNQMLAPYMQQANGQWNQWQSGQYQPVSVNPAAPSGFKDARGTNIEFGKYNANAIQQGFNLDPDGKYRKTEVTEDPNALEYSDGFKALNVGLDLTRFLAGTINDAKQSKKEREKLLRARYMQSQENPYEKGLNNVPVYYQYGGGKPKQNGGEVFPISFKPKVKKAFNAPAPNNYGIYNGIVDANGNHIDVPTEYQAIHTMIQYMQNNTPESNVYRPQFMHHSVNTSALPPLTVAQNGGIMPNKNDFPDLESYNAAYEAYITSLGTGQQPQAINNLPQTPQAKEAAPTYQGDSIVDYLKSRGLMSDKAARKDIATAYGIKDYNYTAEQNLALLNALRTHTKVPSNVVQTSPRKGSNKKTYTKREEKQAENIIKSNNPILEIAKNQVNRFPIPGANAVYNQGTTPVPNDGLTYEQYILKKIADDPTTPRNVRNKRMKRDAAILLSAASAGYTAGAFLGAGAAATSPAALLGNSVNLGTFVGRTTQAANAGQKLLPYAQKLLSYQQGGNPAVNNTGYTPGTSTFNNPYNIIPSNDITMEQTPFPVMGYPNVGQPQLMQPGGRYKFPGAQHVTEVPHFQQGGMPQANAELEQGEVFQTQQGALTKVPESEPRHEDGGSPQANVQRVLEDTSDKRKDQDSKYLKITPDEAEQLTGFRPKTAISHSKLHEKAVEFHGKKLKTFERKLKTNMDFIKYSNGGKLAKNSLDENLKMLQTFPTPGDIFDTLYNHQEEVKMKYAIDQQQQMQYGGPNLWNGDKTGPRKQQKDAGLDRSFNKGDLSWLKRLGFPATFAGLESFAKSKGYDENKVDMTYIPAGDQAKNKYGKLQKWLVDENVKQGNFDVFDNLVNKYQPTNTAVELGVDPNAKFSFDAETPPGHFYMQFVDGKPIGVRTGALGQALAPFEEPAGSTAVVTGQPETPQAKAAAPAGIPPTPEEQRQYNFKSKTGVDNKFNEPLRWYDTMPHVMNYLSSMERTPVDLEQLQRDKLRVHEESYLPQIMQTQGDFNAGLDMLPTNGVGYANQANLMAGKYAVDQQAIAGVESRNKQKFDQLDAQNEANQFQLDQANLGLRDQFNNRVLQGKEIQRQSKLNAFNDFSTMVAQNRKLNREGNLVLELTPYFNQFAQYNGREYNLGNFQSDVQKGRYRVESVTLNNGEVQEMIIDNVTGKRIPKSQTLQSKKPII